MLHRRRYVMLDSTTGKISDNIPSSKITGSLHVARFPKDWDCFMCNEPIYAGQPWVQVHIIGCEPLHPWCVIPDEDGSILVAVTKRNWLGREVPEYACVRLTADDLRVMENSFWEAHANLKLGELIPFGHFWEFVEHWQNEPDYIYGTPNPLWKWEETFSWWFSRHAA